MSAPCPQTDKKIRRTLGPHSRLLTKGVVGLSIDGRGVDGRYLRHAEANLIAHLGGNPSTTEMILIRHLARVMLRIEKFHAKLESGEWTDHDGRVFGALQNVLLRSIATLGLKPATARPLTNAETMAALSAAAARGQREHLDEEE